MTLQSWTRFLPLCRPEFAGKRLSKRRALSLREQEEAQKQAMQACFLLTIFTARDSARVLILWLTKHDARNKTTRPQDKQQMDLQRPQGEWEVCGGGVAVFSSFFGVRFFGVRKKPFFTCEGQLFYEKFLLFLVSVGVFLVIGVFADAPEEKERQRKREKATGKCSHLFGTRLLWAMSEKSGKEAGNVRLFCLGNIRKSTFLEAAREYR